LAMIVSFPPAVKMEVVYIYRNLAMRGVPCYGGIGGVIVTVKIVTPLTLALDGRVVIFSREMALEFSPEVDGGEAHRGVP
jgi:hypothetical protein